MPPVPARKFKVPTTILKTEADGGFEATLVAPGRMQKHDIDRAIVVAEDKLGRSQNGALDQGEKTFQRYGKQLGKVSRYSS